MAEITGREMCIGSKFHCNVDVIVNEVKDKRNL